MSEILNDWQELSFDLPAPPLVDVGVLTVEKVRAINQAGGIIIDTDAQNGCYDDTGAYVCGN